MNSRSVRSTLNTMIVVSERRDSRVRGNSLFDPLVHRGGSRRLIVWLAFGAALIWAVAGVSWLVAPDPVAAATWAAEVPGRLDLNGLPRVHTEVIDRQTAEVIVVSKQARQTFTVSTTDIASMRIFWRGKTLIIDAGGGSVWRVDPKRDLLLRAPASYGWPETDQLADPSER
jgi:hypothetical protein